MTISELKEQIKEEIRVTQEKLNALKEKLREKTLFEKHKR